MFDICTIDITLQRWARLNPTEDRPQGIGGNVTMQTRVQEKKKKRIEKKKKKKKRVTEGVYRKIQSQ